MPNPTKRPTIRDIAQAAGVSAQTISRVINQRPEVALETRQHVLKVMQKMKYRPNRAAQMLASQRSNILEVITMDITYSGPFKETVSSTARASGYQVIFSEVTAAGFADALHNAAAQLIDGLVLIPSMLEIDVSEEDIRSLTQGIPFVQVATYIGSQLPSVVYDQRQGARLAVQHLIDLGHRHVAEIQGPAIVLDAAMRHEGWLQTLNEYGLEPGTTITGDFSAAGGYEAAQRLLAQDTSFTAIFVGNDDMALGVIHALRQHGLSVPDDVSVVGFDNTKFAPYYSPPLTTVFQDFRVMGELVVEYLISMINNPRTPAYQRVLTPVLVVRDSTRPPRSR